MFSPFLDCRSIMNARNRHNFLNASKQKSTPSVMDRKLAIPYFIPGLLLSFELFVLFGMQILKSQYLLHKE
ncbi:hypothetical protein J2S06_002761 [Bacillus alveayuensis]|uniref:Uncharacterized protein n=1 Tax=Aeribacillus alveayuensis TaxID=279215 RepID=A0ABT9VS12_9BACI|nr:hypothetical protein [Bacillus alveayuensis]